MATIQIPVYDSPQVASKPIDPGTLRVNDVSPVPYGSEIGQGIEKAAASIAHVVAGQREFARAEAERADRYRAMDLETKFAKEVNDILYNGQSGFFLSQQENALNTQPVYDAIQKVQEKYAGMAANPYQVNDFNARASRAMLTYGKLIEEHVGKERLSLYSSNANARIKQVFDDINLNYNRPDIVEEKLQHGVPDLVDFLKNVKGLPTSAINNEVKEYMIKGFEVALQGYASREGMSRAGMKYLDDPLVQGTLGAEADKWRAKFQTGVDKEDGAEIAAQFFEQAQKVDPIFPDEKGPFNGLEDLRRKGAKGEKGGITFGAYEEAHARLSKKFEDFRKARAEEEGSYMTAGIADYDKNGHRLELISAPIKSYLVEHGEWHKMELMDRAWHAEKANQPPTKDQIKTLAHIYWLGSENMNAFDDVSENQFTKEYIDKLTLPQYHEAIRYAASLRGRPDKQTPGAPNAQQLLVQQLGQHSIIPTEDTEAVKVHDPRTWPEREATNFRYASEQLQTWLKGEMLKHPKVPVSEEEINKWIRDKMVDVYDPTSKSKWNFGGPKHYTKLEAEARGIHWVLTMDIDKIDPVERQQIREFYQAMYHRDPTVQETLARYEFAHRHPRRPGEPPPTPQGVVHETIYEPQAGK